MATKTWEKTERSVTLTNEQWNKLACYILMTTKYRRGEREAWERLAKEKNDDGTPTFSNAAGNAEFWATMDAELDAIRKIIDGV